MATKRFTILANDRGNLTSSIVDVLGQRIISNQYSSHESMATEAQLAQEFEVSHSVIREAVKTLSALGLITVKPKAGIHLQSRDYWDYFDDRVMKWLFEAIPTEEFFNHIRQIRIMFEPKSCALAAEYGSDNDLKLIEEAFRKLASHYGGPTAPDMLKDDLEFHMSIHRASGNPMFLRIGRVIQTALELAINIEGNKFNHLAEEHEAVMRAVVARDSPRAHNAMMALILRGSDDTKKSLDAA